MNVCAQLYMYIEVLSPSVARDMGVDPGHNRVKLFFRALCLSLSLRARVAELGVGRRSLVGLLDSLTDTDVRVDDMAFFHGISIV